MQILNSSLPPEIARHISPHFYYYLVLKKQNKNEQHISGQKTIVNTSEIAIDENPIKLC